MSAKPILVVFGATGIQGGSVVSHFLSLDPQPYRLRGITRNTSSSASKALTEKGVEMVAGNLDDTSSLVKAFQGASVIFTVTDFWHPFYDPEHRAKAAAANKHITVFTYEYELQQNKNIFDAAAQIDTLDRLIYSSLSDATKWSGGKYPHVYHFISKAHAEVYAKEKYPELWKKTSIIQVGFYLSNILPGQQPLFTPKKDEDGNVVFDGFGKGSNLPMIATEEDTGPLVHALLQVAPGQNLIGVRKWMQMDDFAETFGRVLGVPTRMSNAARSSDNFPEELREEFVDSIAYTQEIGYAAETVDKSLVQPDQLGVPVNLETVEEWIKKQDWSGVFDPKKQAPRTATNQALETS